MKRTFLASGINWDVDGVDRLDFLPSEAEVSIEIAPDEELGETEIADALSNTFGDCVNSIDEVKEIFKAN